MGDTATNRAIHGRLQELVGPSRGGGTKELADGIGMPLGTVDRYVKGDRNPPHDFLLKVADWYEVSLDWLYGRSESGGAEQAEEKAPAWARRMDARLRFLERKLSAMPGQDLTVEEIVRIAVEAARRPRRAAAGRAEGAAPDPSAGETGAAVR